MVTYCNNIFGFNNVYYWNFISPLSFYFFSGSIGNLKSFTVHVLFLLERPGLHFPLEPIPQRCGSKHITRNSSVRWPPAGPFPLLTAQQRLTWLSSAALCSLASRDIMLSWLFSLLADGGFPQYPFLNPHLLIISFLIQTLSIVDSILTNAFKYHLWGLHSSVSAAQTSLFWEPVC